MRSTRVRADAKFNLAKIVAKFVWPKLENASFWNHRSLREMPAGCWRSQGPLLREVRSAKMQLTPPRPEASCDISLATLRPQPNYQNDKERIMNIGDFRRIATDFPQRPGRSPQVNEPEAITLRPDPANTVT